MIDCPEQLPATIKKQIKPILKEGKNPPIVFVSSLQKDPKNKAIEDACVNVVYKRAPYNLISKYAKTAL